jgi:hypothetical protein
MVTLLQLGQKLLRTMGRMGYPDNKKALADALGN